MLLITGAGGQLGQALTSLLPTADARPKAALDVTDPDAVLRAVAGTSVVIHLAAMTDVDGAEMAPERAREVNDLGTGNVVAAARHHGARVVYLSTDYVFRGDDPPYAEDDPPGPVNVYGRTKLAGEHHLDPRVDLIVRTSWLYGHGRNFIASILRSSSQSTLTVVDDQFGRPTSATDLASAIHHMVGVGTSGVIHVAGDGEPCSWADLAELALQVGGFPTRVARVDSEAYAATATRSIAPRPADATLSLERARSTGVPLVDWRSSVTAYVRELT